MPFVKQALSNLVSVSAHRGQWNAEIPENSLPAILQAINSQCDIVEIDIRKTKDGHFVLMHDEYIDRTTNGSGRLSEYNLRELMEYSLTNLATGAPTTYKVPTLLEALGVCQNKIILNLDKTYEHIPEILPLLELTGTYDQVIFKGNHRPKKVLKDYGHLIKSQDIFYVPIIDSDEEDAEEYLFEYERLFNPGIFEFFIKSSHQRVVSLFRKALKKGAKIWANPVSHRVGHGFYEESDNPEACWEHIINQGAGILNTNRPQEMLRFLRDRSLHV